MFPGPADSVVIINTGYINEDVGHAHFSSGKVNVKIKNTKTKLSD